MRIALHVDPVTALLAGRDACHWQVVDVPSSLISDPLRKTLTIVNQSSVADQYSAEFAIPVCYTLPNATFPGQELHEPPLDRVSSPVIAEATAETALLQLQGLQTGLAAIQPILATQHTQLSDAVTRLASAQMQRQWAAHLLSVRDAAALLRHEALRGLAKPAKQQQLVLCLDWSFSLENEDFAHEDDCPLNPDAYDEDSDPPYLHALHPWRAAATSLTEVAFLKLEQLRRLVPQARVQPIHSYLTCPHCQTCMSRPTAEILWFTGQIPLVLYAVLGDIEPL